MEAGVGRTLDKVMTFLGTRLTSLISRISECHLGKGPNALVGRMINSIDWAKPACQHDFCRNHHLRGRGGQRTCLSKSPPRCGRATVLVVLSWVSGFICSIIVGQQYAQRRLREADQRRSNSSVRLLTAYYICALASFHPHIRQIFINFEATEALYVLVQESRFSAEDILVSPSRRALISVSESAVIPVIKDFNALELKFDEYHHQQLTDNEMTALLPHSVNCLSILMRGLLELQLQVLVASRLSLSIVWQDLSLTSILPSLRSSLNGDIVQSLWRLLASSTDPVVSGTFRRLMFNLNDFGTKSCFNQWDITKGCHVTSAGWAWYTLRLPLFRLSVYSRGSLSNSFRRSVTCSSSGIPLLYR
ncbi:hypothetical protein NEOLEDRAFT_403241 [Neolentinus lepideus HHB14362 ss-1]|uniref:Uncharacterized protein n=1 Tax=Neolentinus lepideus HHB14362 ss-1 TaxID=1314782 RepID=A0A165S3C1_9AGAM|nr:hypothetical protein NEOLEDRAFT_403241 [Neolentinus lepideus HHB14362 ss-1]